MITNINRDGFWLPDLKGAAAISWSTDSASATCNSSGVVNTDIGSFKSTGTSATSVGQQSIGTFMVPPKEDYVPYRVKAFSASTVFFTIAYAPATITGTDDILQENNPISFQGRFDELIMLPPHPVGDSFYNRPICFAIQTFSSGVSAVRLSVQNLGIAQPRITMGVS